ncbi:conserved virulence factor C family protein [Peribacillus sp. SCS-37]|uniref:conserved virulence factor C family protein n=1 Tax=Paraperibacillus esterisolvens TaxID=3115296 RepID=UPI0039067419
MQIKAIEPTPSPNTMKIILDEELPFGKSNNYKSENVSEAPGIIQELLGIEGVKGVYHVADFLALERNARYDWRDILQHVRTIFGERPGGQEQASSPLQGFGEVDVQVQMFKDIPMQVKLKDASAEKRFGLPRQFADALARAQAEGDNVVLLRKWKDWGTRYGELDEIGTEIIGELVSTYTEAKLAELAAAAQNPELKAEHKRRAKKKPVMKDLDHPDWEHRYRALEGLGDPKVEDIPLLEKALNDEKISIRRQAVVYLGMIEDQKVLPALYKALKDKAVTVRRTAGDCLSDLGFSEAMEEMAAALQDKNKLVRWRAAMFLYESGNESVLPALHAAEEDPEFEVAMQVKMAIDRIENGEEAKGSVWKQMTEARSNK